MYSVTIARHGWCVYIHCVYLHGCLLCAGEEDDDPVEVDGSLCAQRDVLKDREVGKDDIVEISLKLKRPDDLDTRILLDDMIMIVYVTLTGKLPTSPPFQHTHVTL